MRLVIFAQSPHLLPRHLGSTGEADKIQSAVAKDTSGNIQQADLWKFLLVELREITGNVEHNLAKVGVEGSNPFARSNFQS